MDKCAIVVTSIFDNNWLERLTTEIQRSGEIYKTTIIYIADHKTPPSIFEKIRNLKFDGFSIIAPTLDEQISLEQKHGLEGFILENSDHRRNLGYLIAYLKEFDFVISMDDDNFPLSTDFIESHRSRLGDQSNSMKKVISSPTHAYNNCLLLDESTFLHPRGYPFQFRNKNSQSYTSTTLKISEVGVNAGMWTIAPDVDAISWLINKQEFENVSEVPDIVLASDTYCPINSQNTSLLRKYIPAYYFVKMGYDIGGGLKFDRLGDIYSGYFLQKIVKSNKGNISFGNPLVTHERNSHNYLDDANGEWGCLRTIDVFFEWLVSLRLNETNILDSCLELASALDDFSDRARFKHMPTATKGFYHSMSYDMRRWNKLFRNL